MLRSSSHNPYSQNISIAKACIRVSSHASQIVTENTSVAARRTRTNREVYQVAEKGPWRPTNDLKELFRPRACSWAQLSAQAGLGFSMRRKPFKHQHPCHAKGQAYSPLCLNGLEDCLEQGRVIKVRRRGVQLGCLGMNGLSTPHKHSKTVSVRAFSSHIEKAPVWPCVRLVPIHCSCRGSCS